MLPQQTLNIFHGDFSLFCLDIFLALNRFCFCRPCTAQIRLIKNGWSCHHHSSHRRTSLSKMDCVSTRTNRQHRQALLHHTLAREARRMCLCVMPCRAFVLFHRPFVLLFSFMRPLCLSPHCFLFYTRFYEYTVMYIILSILQYTKPIHTSSLRAPSRSILHRLTSGSAGRFVFATCGTTETCLHFRQPTPGSPHTLRKRRPPHGPSAVKGTYWP